MSIPIPPIPRDTNRGLAEIIRILAREAMRVSPPESYGAPSEAVEGKLFPDPTGSKLYIYLDGVRREINIDV